MIVAFRPGCVEESAGDPSMIIAELLRLLDEKNIKLSVVQDELVVHGKGRVLDSSVLTQLRENKQALLELIRRGEYGESTGDAIEASLQEAPLIVLTAEEIELIVSGVPGGVGNVQDIYPLAPLQEGIFFHHLMGGEGDPYLLAYQLSFDSRRRLEGYVGALQAVINRHDILRTALMWEGLSEPVQVVWRNVVLPVEEVQLDPAAGDAGRQLLARFGPRRFRIDVRQAPWLRVYIAEDQEKGG